MTQLTQSKESTSPLVLKALLGRHIRIKNSEQTHALALTTSNMLSASRVSGLERANCLTLDVQDLDTCQHDPRGTANCLWESKTANVEKRSAPTLCWSYIFGGVVGAIRVR